MVLKFIFFRKARKMMKPLILAFCCFSIIHCRFLLLDEENINGYDVIFKLNTPTITACVLRCQQNCECEFPAYLEKTKNGHPQCLFLKKKVKQAATELEESSTTLSEVTGEDGTNAIQDLLILKEVRTFLHVRFSENIL